jgi:DNA-binding SARP family transcriptional activator/predicted ATPase
VVHLRFLGEFALLCGDEPVTQLASVRLQSLLAYLALHRNAPHPRQHLAFLFWPDATEQQARNSLRQLVHQLRRVWPAVDRYLTADASTLAWRGVLVRSDVAEFEDALSRADEAVRRADTAAERAALEEAVGVYRGDLLPSCYDDWLASEREQLNQRFSRTLDRLIDVLEGRREYRAAIEYTQWRLRHDQLEEQAYCRLMHLHAVNHDRASALRVYHACASMLEQELAVEPSPATSEAYERLVRLPAMPAPALGPALESAPPLVGRQVEWTQLRAAWQRAVRGEAHLVVITGEAGIGTSRLADELYVWAARQGIATAQTRAYAAEGRLSYAPVTDWLRSECVQPALVRLDAAWQSEVARLLPELVSRQADLQNTGTVGPQRQRLFEALARAVLSADQPLLLRLDDLQWCDQDTLEWLHYLLRFDPRARLLVVGTARTEEIEVGHALAALLLNLRGAGQLHEIALGPLDGAETAELAAHAAGRKLDPDQASHVYRETEGNPLFVVEAVRAARTDLREPSAMVGRRTPDMLPLDPQRLPPKVHAVIAARLAQLSDSGRKLAGLAATIGRAFTLDVLARAHDGDEESLVSGVDELWRRRIVREHGTNAYDFAHDKIREVAYAEVTPARRPVLHRRVAEALEQVHAADLDVVSAQLAAHYEHAGLSDRAVVYYQIAAHVVQRVYANEQVVSLLRRALGLLASLPPSQARDERELPLQTTLGVSLVATRGYGAPEAVAVYRRAHELSQGLGEPPNPSMLRALALASIAHADFQQAHDMGDSLLSLAQRDGDPILLVEAHYVLGVTLFWKGAFGPARSHLEAALANHDSTRSAMHIAAYTQDPGVVCLIRLAVVLWFPGRADESDRRRAESLVLAHRVAHPFSLGYALGWDAILQSLRGDALAARTQADAAIALSREHGLDFWLAMATVVRGWALAEAGEIQVGINAMREGIAAFQATGSIFTQPYFLALLAGQYARVGHVAQGLSLLDEALATVQATGERCWEAELYWRKGDLLQKQRGRGVEANVAFNNALGVARYQGAKAIELRAAASLAGSARDITLG